MAKLYYYTVCMYEYVTYPISMGNYDAPITKWGWGPEGWKSHYVDSHDA